MTFVLLLAFLSFLFAGHSGHAQGPCEQCVKASQNELRRCLNNAISQEDKISCADKQDAQASLCEEHECKAERAQRSRQGEAPVDKKPSSEQ